MRSVTGSGSVATADGAGTRHVNRARLSIARCKWIDAVITMEEWNEEEYPETAEIESVGWLVANTDASVVLALDLLDDGTRMLVAIPRCCVLELEVIL